VPPNQGAGERNIAQPYVTCQEKLLIALDKHFLTKRKRLVSATSCDAKCTNETHRAHATQFSKSRNQIANQSVTQGMQFDRKTLSERARSNSDSRFNTAPGRAQQSTGSRNLSPRTTLGLAKSHFLTKRALIRASDSLGH
jgi:hypothetical protein